jgi:hypothetical protein
MSPPAWAIHKVVALIDRDVSVETGGFPKKIAQVTHLRHWRFICSASRKPVVVTGALLTLNLNQKGTGDEETREPSLQSCPDSAPGLHRR